MSTQPSKQQGSTQRKYKVRITDLPLSCPMETMRVWDSHPRVYLPIAATGHARCPYCDAEFSLEK